MNVSAVMNQGIPPAAAEALLPRDTAPGAVRPNAPADVRKAAAQFEAILLRQLLSPAIEPLMNGGLAGASGTGGGVYGYMLTDVLATSLSQGGGLGLAQLLTQQLSPRGTPPADPAGTPAADGTPSSL
jgi:peptidoglycan hydrolase FlgJ